MRDRDPRERMPVWRRETLITSRQNEKLRLVRKLLSARKHREETGLFAVEGEDLVEAAAGQGIEPVELLVAGENVVPELLGEVSTLGHAPRVVGVYRRGGPSDGTRGTSRSASGSVSDPGNVGTLIRAADAFGACVCALAGVRRPGRAARCARLGGRDLPRPARRLGRRCLRGASRSSLTAASLSPRSSSSLR